MDATVMTPAGAAMLLAFDAIALPVAVIGLRRRRPEPRSLWWAFASIIGIVCVGDVVALIGGGLMAGALYALSYVVAIVSLGRLSRLRGAGDVDAVLDGLFYAAVALGALWLFTVPDLSGDLTGAVIIRLFFACGHTIAAFFAVRLLLDSARTDPTAKGLNASLALLVASDAGSAIAGQGWYDVPWIVGLGLVRLALAATLFAPAVARAADRRPGAGPMGRGRAVAQGTTVMALAVALLVVGLREASLWLLAWPPVVATIGLVTTSRILRLIGSQQHAERRLRRAADIDALTSLGNRRSLMLELEHRLSREDVEVRVAVLFIDLDNFKLVNDTLGHQTGDALLRAVSARFLNAIRPGDRLFRFGGDEFAVLADVHTEDEAGALAERLRAVTGGPVSLEGVPLSVGASIGVRIARQGDTPDQLLSEADAAMYAAKADGRGRIRRFSHDTARASLPDLALAGRLQSAVTNGELVLHYQPVWWLADGTAAGAEALVRWRHPEYGLVHPDRFLPIAGRIGALDLIGHWVRRQGFADLSAALAASSVPQNLQIGVNLSGSELVSDTIVNDVVRQLAEADLSPSHVVLEIVGTSVVEDGRAVRALRGLRSAGLRISLDDFGSGWATLDGLARLPLTALKLDRRLIQQAVEDLRARRILGTVVRLTADLGLVSVGQGVENTAQLEMLRGVGCPLVQGFLTGRPMPGLAAAIQPERAAALRSIPTIRGHRPRSAAG